MSLPLRRDRARRGAQRDDAPPGGPLRARATLACAALALAAAAQPVPAAALRAGPIVVGMIAPLSGEGASYGLGLREGVELAVARANEAGGIDGRHIELVALDDRGDPAAAAAHARELLERGAVAITGVHGAPAAAAVADVLAGAAALVAPATGAEGVREPPRPGVFHLRAGTFDEMNAAMLHLDTVGITRYGIVVADGMFGDSARSSLELQLVRIGLKPVVLQRLTATGDPRAVMAAVCGAQPQVVVLAVDEARTMALVDAARALACAVQYLVFSETGAALAGKVRTGHWHPPPGLMITQVVPHPGNLSHPLVAEYRRALAAAARGVGTDPGSYPAIEGYQAMRLLAEALRACTRQTTRACVVQALSGRSFDVGGQHIQLGSTQRQPRPYVEITLLDEQGRFRR